MLARSSFRPHVAAVIGGLVTLGCYEPESEFEQFNFRCDRASDGICAEAPAASVGPDECLVPDVPNDDDVALVGGKFFTAIGSRIPTAELFPTMQQVEITNPVHFPEGCEIRDGNGVPINDDDCEGIRLTVRSRAVEACNPSVPLSPEFEERGDFVIQQDGSLVLDFGEITIGGAGNAITQGPIRSETRLVTRVCTNRPDFICGAAVGQLFEPVALELDGTFALVRVDEHGEVPEKIFLDCEMTEAAPVGEFPTCMGG